MNNLKKQMNNLFTKQLESKEIINVVLYSIILVMPFIVTNVSGPRYVIGKVYFLYIFTVLAFIVTLKIGRFKLEKEHIVAIIFLITLFIASIISPYKEIAFIGNYDRSEGFLMIFIYVILFIISSKYIILNNKSLNIILTVASAMSIYGIFQFYGIDPVQKFALGEILVSSSIGMIGNRNFFSTYICIFLFISMALYILKGKKENLIFSSILFAGLLCSLTRSGWLAFGIYSIIGSTFIIKRKECLKRAIAILSLFIVILTVINITSEGKIIARVDKNLIVEKPILGDDSLEQEIRLVGSPKARIDIMKMTWKAFIQKPLLGTGPDTLKNRLSEDCTEEFVSYLLRNNETVDKAHNEYLEYAANGGVFTLISYLTLIGLIIYGLIKNLKDDNFKIMLLVLIGYLVQAFFNISVIMVAPIFWIFLGYCVQSIYKKIAN